MAAPGAFDRPWPAQTPFVQRQALNYLTLAAPDVGCFGVRCLVGRSPLMTDTGAAELWATPLYIDRPRHGAVAWFCSWAVTIVNMREGVRNGFHAGRRALAILWICSKTATRYGNLNPGEHRADHETGRVAGCTWRAQQVTRNDPEGGLCPPWGCSPCAFRRRSPGRGRVAPDRHASATRKDGAAVAKTSAALPVFSARPV